jgi:hypothetical protein
MCTADDNYAQLRLGQHGTFHLRVANTTMHLTQQQVLALHAKLNQCVRSEPSDNDSSPEPDTWCHNRFGQSSN